MKRFAEWEPVPFFIPSHKMGEGLDPRFKSFAGDNIFKIDLSEVRWTDDFHGAASSIKEAQELAADAWGAEKSFFLVNGTSGGIIAAICSVVGEGDKIIVPRNAHKSAIYGLIVSGAEPVYVMPETIEDLGLIGGLAPETLEKAFEENPDAKAVFTVSPTYHGVMSDTASLAEISHRYGAVFISDEAHGNHMYFSDRLPEGALELGADIVCQSTHKMSGALTQASILHLGREAAGRVDFDKVKANLSMIQTTSPSYILLASLDSARSYIATQGEILLDGVLDALEKAREEIAAISGLEVLGDIPLYEPTRLVVSARALGIDGYELFRILREDYDIECEFADPLWCVCVAGLGTLPSHTEALVKALKEISKNSINEFASKLEKVLFSELSDVPGKFGEKEFANAIVKNLKKYEDKLSSAMGDALQEEFFKRRQSVLGSGDTLTVLPPIPPLRMTPRKAWFAKKETITFEKARERISAELVVPYPPGIPVLCPGEEVTDAVHEFLSSQREAGRHMHCAAGDSLATLSVVVD